LQHDIVTAYVSEATLVLVFFHKLKELLVDELLIGAENQKKLEGCKNDTVTLYVVFVDNFSTKTNMS